MQELLQSYYITSSFLEHDKCGFERTSIEYLGLFSLEEEIWMDDEFNKGSWSNIIVSFNNKGGIVINLNNLYKTASWLFTTIHGFYV
jgi:hypothetical protein